MSAVITLEDAQARLKQLIEHLKPGDELIITEHEKPVARLIAAAGTQRQPRKPGSLRGTVVYMAPDFDAPLEDFKEYMQ